MKVATPGLLRAMIERDVTALYRIGTRANDPTEEQWREQARQRLRTQIANMRHELLDAEQIERQRLRAMRLARRRW